MNYKCIVIQAMIMVLVIVSASTMYRVLHILCYILRNSLTRKEDRFVVYALACLVYTLKRDHEAEGERVFILAG